MQAAGRQGGRQAGRQADNKGLRTLGGNKEQFLSKRINVMNSVRYELNHREYLLLYKVASFK